MDNEAVRAIVAAVRSRGDAALVEFTKKFDRVDFAPSALRVTAAEIEAAYRACAGPALALLAWSLAVLLASPILERIL